jgi:asparagine synthase (glutamine-hydrolysing)
VSGFVAILHGDGRPVEPDLLQNMTEAMAHCGPDRRETWFDGGVGLGHALLAAAPGPPDAERQPCRLDGPAWIAADARVDARGELMAALRARGRDVTGDPPDAELILHAYHAWGERCVEHLTGDFAFAIWDGARRRLFCARDQFGVVPLYYARPAGGLAVSNVLNCLRRHPEVSDQLDERAIGDFLLFHVNRDVATTTFADIRAVPPANVLTCEDGEPRLARYWDLPREAPLREAPEQRVERFAAAFDQAVGDRLRANRVGTQLSGGMDSTSIAVSAHRLLAQRGDDFDLRAYTIVYDRLIAEEEGHYAGLVAKASGLPVEHVVADEYLSRPPDGEIDWVYPEPWVIPNRLAEYEIGRRVASFARGLLVGFGGDPLFQVAPRGLRGRTRSLVRRLIPRRPREVTLPDWINPDFAARLDLADRWRAAVDPGRGRRALDAMADPFWVALFGFAHPGANGHAIRTLFPFFDVRLVELVLQAPPAWRRDKRLLREAMRGRVPEAVRLRPKTPLYRSAERDDTADPRYQVAERPDARRWRADLLRTAGIGEYVCVERALQRIESPIPTRTMLAFDNCFPLAHWLRSERVANLASAKETPHGTHPTRP